MDKDNISIYYVGAGTPYKSLSSLIEALHAGFSEDPSGAGFSAPDGQDGQAAQTPYGEAFDESYPAPVSALPRIIIHLAPGVYEERLVINRPNITLIGDGSSPADVQITADAGAFELLDSGEKRGTFRTATVRIEAQDFIAENLTFANTAGQGNVAGQALALYNNGDRAYYRNCRFLGHQDTIFLAPLPLKEAQPGGFRGPGELRPRKRNRSLFDHCYIEGTIDFIFGGGASYFTDCDIFCKKLPASSSRGFITAASTPQEAGYGLVFSDCRISGDCAKNSYCLGRPWREYARTVFLSCDLSDCIADIGWEDWNKDHSHFYYAEYPGSENSAENLRKKRADFSHQLSETDLSLYRPDLVLDGWSVASSS